MLSAQTMERLRRVHEAEPDYMPLPDVAARQHPKTLVALFGATCAGKGTTMDAIPELDPDFHIAGTQTSREKRNGDNPTRYTYHSRTDKGLRPFLDAIEARRVVQYAVHPHTWDVYGSMPEDYPGEEFNVADVLTTAIGGFERGGFQGAPRITIARRRKFWLPQVDRRFPLGHPRRPARRDEAIVSFMWSLAQGPDHFWVENVEGHPEIAAAQVIAIARGESAGQPEARHLAEECLEAARGMRV